MIKKPSLAAHSTTRRDFLLVCSLLAITLLASGCNATRQSENLPNIVVILTDDQRWDTLWAMPVIREKLAQRGVTFTNAFVTTPSCAPSRASILSGGFYAHNTGVLTNNERNGGISHFRDSDTLATMLKSRGYKTGFVGKYMHGYIPGYIPPGWTQFVANNDGGMIDDWFNLIDVTVGQSRFWTSYGKVIRQLDRQYLTDFQRDQALDFLSKYGQSRFFLFLSTYAPHTPSVPAPIDRDKFSQFFYRGQRAYREKDLSDKPMWVQEAARYSHFPWNKDPANQDSVRQDYLRSLAAVDRAVSDIIEKILDLGVMENTIFFFTSDNGLLWEEHGLLGKGSPYEEAIHVPLIVSMPGLEPRNEEALVAMNLDLPATILELAGIKRPTDGLSLLPILEKRDVSWRSDLLLESYGYLEWWRQKFGFKAAGLGRWAGIRTINHEGQWKYVEHPTGETELYDLKSDPFEKDNKHSDPVYQGMIQSLSQRLRELKGLMITSDEAPEAKKGQPYVFNLKAWGGQEPYAWKITWGTLPQGLSLDAKGGTIRGTPVKRELKFVEIQVTGNSIGKHSEKPQAFVHRYRFIVK